MKEGLLHQIINKRSIDISFQMIISPMDNIAFFLEAFVKGVHPKTGEVISPGALFSAAKKEKQIVALDMICFEEIIKASRPFINKFNNAIVFINIEQDTLLEISPSHGFAKILKKYGILTKNVAFDLSDIPLAGDLLEKVHKSIQINRNDGFYISIDDIGKDYVNIDKIILFHPDIVKLNEQFIEQLKMPDYRKSLVKYIPEIAHEMGILVVVKGIESHQNLVHAIEHGAQMMQGFYISKPRSMDVDAFEQANWNFNRSSITDLLSVHYFEDERSSIQKVVTFADYISNNVNHDDLTQPGRLFDGQLDYDFIESFWLLNDQGQQISDSYINKTGFKNRNEELFGIFKKGTSHVESEYYSQLSNTMLTVWVTRPYRSRLSNDISMTASFIVDHGEEGQVIICMNINYPKFYNAFNDIYQEKILGDNPICLLIEEE